jgi:radical SAM protein with 4Fe4S-binding SPASM domain
MNAPPLRVVALEITRSCPLACRHCRGDSHDRAYEDELSFGEITAILENIALFAHPILIITGGEPLTRPDVFDIAARSSTLGFKTTLATCGHLLDDASIAGLLRAGVQRISVSLDGAVAGTHDRFRGVPGAFDSAIRGIAAARKHDLPFQINSTLTALNAGELEALHDLARSLGAEAFHPFLLVPMGRGRGLADSALSPQEYERVLGDIARIAADSPLEIKPTCSPHYIRIAGGAARGAEPGAAGGMTRGCLGGQGFVFVSHRGKVQMCGFLDLEAGDLRRSGYDLKRIWETSPLFLDVRDTTRYRGKCGRCEYVRACGGCRARAYEAFGDHLGEEPNCAYQPAWRRDSDTIPT